MFKVNDIVQIVDDHHPWFPCLMIVEEVKTWGVLAYVLVPGSNSEPNVGEAYLRVKNEQLKLVGVAVMVHPPDEEK